VISLHKVEWRWDMSCKCQLIGSAVHNLHGQGRQWCLFRCPCDDIHVLLWVKHCAELLRPREIAVWVTGQRSTFVSHMDRFDNGTSLKVFLAYMECCRLKAALCCSVIVTTQWWKEINTALACPRILIGSELCCVCLFS